MVSVQWWRINVEKIKKFYSIVFPPYTAVKTDNKASKPNKKCRTEPTGPIRHFFYRNRVTTHHSSLITHLITLIGTTFRFSPAVMRTK
jgi:hypothetical protein